MTVTSNASHINQILIVGGTHGNELSGVQAVNNWMASDAPELRSLVPSARLSFCMANQAAVHKRTRYVDEDLNRQFTAEKLNHTAKYTTTSQPSSAQSLEARLARDLSQKYGKTSQSQCDFVIDIHNTTSNMGATLIVLVNDEFHQQLARFVKKHMPQCNILVEDYQTYDKFAYLCTLGKKGVMIEVGPQAHSTLNAVAYHQTCTMTALILRFLELHNTDNIKQLKPVQAYRLDKEIAYPTSINKNTGAVTKTAMIHPKLNGQDFQKLQQGDPCFISFEGEDIPWLESDTYPHFIGEAAYDHLHLAFASADKCFF